MKGEEVLAKMREYGVAATLRTLQRYEAASELGGKNQPAESAR